MIFEKKTKKKLNGKMQRETGKAFPVPAYFGLELLFSAIAREACGTGYNRGPLIAPFKKLRIIFLKLARG